jgi:hypothetical protein
MLKLWSSWKWHWNVGNHLLQYRCNIQLQSYLNWYTHTNKWSCEWILTWKRVRDGLGMGLDMGLGRGLGAGLRSRPLLPRRGSANRPLSGTTGCGSMAVERSKVSHVKEILRDVLLVIRRLPGTPVVGPSSTVSSSSRAAVSLRAQYPLISVTNVTYWSNAFSSSWT